MRLFVALLSMMVLTFGVAEGTYAKRMGKGGFGKTHKSTTHQPQKKTDSAGNAAPQTMQKTQKKSGFMGGLLGGLLAGGLIAALLSGEGFEGFQMMDFIIIGLLAFLAFKVFKMMARKSQPQYAGMPPMNEPQSRSVYHQEAPHHTTSAQEYQHSAAMGRSKDLPPGFDEEAFLRDAVQHYHSLQNAWNEGDMALIKTFVAAELADALEQERSRMKVPPKTEILDLEVEMLSAQREGSIAQITLLFKGSCRDPLERSQDGIYDTWYLERDTAQAGSPWMVVGIEA